MAATGPRVIQQDPLNASTPAKELLAEETPASSFFVRNHFPRPDVDASRYALTVRGPAGSRRWNLADLQRRPNRAILVTFECAGNGRHRFVPSVAGVPWDDLAVGTARWTGTPLGPLLTETGIPDDAVEVLFTGLDEGEEGGRRMRFERSLPVEAAMDPDVLLAWSMNGQPLPADHGGPLRLVVPGWYGVASVKWLDEVRFLNRPFDGWFQRDRYVYRRRDGTVDGPVARMLPKSLIIRPAAGARLRVGQAVSVQGVAWAASDDLDRVEVSTDGGRSWKIAQLESARSRHAARRFQHEWKPDAPGAKRLMARAFGAQGGGQPLTVPWNVHGYGQNAVVPVDVVVE